MTTLYIDRRDAVIEADNGTLLVRGAEGTVARAPLAPVERVVVRGPASLTTGAIAAISGQGAALLVLSGRHGRLAGIMNGTAHADASIRLGQFRLALDPAARAAVARVVLRHKLLGQHRLLAEGLRLRPDRRRQLLRGQAAVAEAMVNLRDAKVLSSAQMMGIEGAAASAFYEAFAALLPPSAGFTGRNRRPPRDPANALLSLAYTLAHLEAVAAAQRAGLDPAVGFLHALFPGRESLACDLVEPLRPFCERLVWRTFAEETLRAAHFTRDGEACLLGKAGRRIFYTVWEEAVAPLRRRLSCGLKPLVRAARAASAGLFDKQDGDA